MKRPAVFLDRDGTISEEVGYVEQPSHLVLFPFAAEAIRLLNENEFLAILVTNQSGIARGYFSEEMLLEIHRYLETSLANKHARLDGIYYCSHHPSIGESPYLLDCDCRKPRTGLIDQATSSFEVDLSASWVIGDRYRDVEMGQNAGVRTALVMTGYGRGEWQADAEKWDRQPDLICENVLEAVKSILAQNR